MAASEDVQNRILTLARPELELLGFDLVDFEVFAGGNQQTLRFSVEKLAAGDETPARINIDEVARASRAIAKAIEAEEAEAGEFLGRYTIEVGSPGIFRRLTRPEHYRRYVGEIVKVVADLAESGSQQVRGRLVAADDESIRVERAPDDVVEIRLDTVRRAKLDPDLDFGGRRKGR